MDFDPYDIRLHILNLVSSYAKLTNRPLSTINFYIGSSDDTIPRALFAKWTGSHITYPRISSRNVFLCLPCYTAYKTEVYVKMITKFCCKIAATITNVHKYTRYNDTQPYFHFEVMFLSIAHSKVVILKYLQVVLAPREPSFEHVRVILKQDNHEKILKRFLYVIKWAKDVRLPKEIVKKIWYYYTLRKDRSFSWEFRLQSKVYGKIERPEPKKRKTQNT